MRLVIEVLRRPLAEESPSWIECLPWAMWTLNGLPGVDGAHSPHFILFGREPIGLGDCPALRHGRATVSAESWMQNTKDIREAVQKLVTSMIHELSERIRSTHRSVVFHVADRVWVWKLPH